MKYLNELDYLRGFAIISVLMLHSGILSLESDYNFRSLLKFGVPTFFFISGLVLTYVYHKRKLDSARALKRFYTRRILYTLVPYFIWAFVYTLVWFPFLGARPTNINDFFFQFITRTLTADWVTLWFVAVIFQFYLLFPLLLKLFDSLRKLQVFTVSVLLLTLGMYLFPSLIDHRFFVPWLFYFMLGMSVGYDWETAIVFLKRPVMKLCISIIWITLFIITPIAEASTPVTRYHYFTPTILAYGFFTAILLLILVKPGTVFLKFFKIAGIYAFGIYLSHRPAMRVLLFILRSVNITPTPILYFILTTPISIFFTFLVQKLPFGKFVVGK